MKFRLLIILAALLPLAACSSVIGSFSLPVTHDFYQSSFAQTWHMPDGSIRETSATMIVDHTGILNGDRRTSDSLEMRPDGSVKKSGGTSEGFQSAVSWWQITAGIIAGWLTKP